MLSHQKGDLFKHLPQGGCLIPHVVNNLGGWGRGFVVPLGRRFPDAELDYRAWAQEEGFSLGEIRSTIQDGFWVVHMLAQNGYRSSLNPCPLDYEALRACMEKTALLAPGLPILTVRFGSGLAGGDWDKIEPLIETYWGSREVTVFEL